MKITLSFLKHGMNSRWADTKFSLYESTNNNKRKKETLAWRSCLLVSSKRIFMTCLDFFRMLLATYIIYSGVSDKAPSDWMLMFSRYQALDYPICCIHCTCAPANLKCWCTRENLGCPRSQLWPISLMYGLFSLWY